jgi:hypothetical protein
MYALKHMVYNNDERSKINGVAVIDSGELPVMGKPVFTIINMVAPEGAPTAVAAFGHFI